MSEAKPVRIKGDPKGYDVVETTDGESCKHCAFKRRQRCYGVLCYVYERPDRKHIHYVKKGKTK